MNFQRQRISVRKTAPNEVNLPTSKKPINRGNKEIINHCFYLIKHNALLRGEQRNTEAAAYHPKH
ncbi:hypothetical protein XM75_c11605 [Vibrio vulnificus]|nr:hypothetical protein XM75_c11605 [Vibrio vulnificus]